VSSKVKFKSNAFETIHAYALALHKLGAMGKSAMRELQPICLSARPEQIKQLREANRISQSVIARYLNTSESTVKKWELGA